MSESSPDLSGRDELVCPVCAYSLRALPEPRCPECGYQFEWAELLEQNRRKLNWFYEHAGTWKSHGVTRWRSLRTWSFWKKIHAYSDTHPRRLRRYQVTTVLLLVAVTVLVSGLSPVQRWLKQSLPRGSTYITTIRPTTGQYRTIKNYPIFALSPSSMRPAGGIGGSSFPTTQVYSVYTPPPVWAKWLEPLAGAQWSYGRRNDPQVGVAGVMSVASVIGLAVYWRLLRGSVLRASIRPIHLSRVAAYSLDALPLLLLVFAAVDIAWLMLLPYNVYAYPSAEYMSRVLIGPWLIVVPVTLRLASALRRYVRFPQAGAVALGYGVILGLTWTIVELRLTF